MSFGGGRRLPCDSHLELIASEADRVSIFEQGPLDLLVVYQGPVLAVKILDPEPCVFEREA